MNKKENRENYLLNMLRSAGRISTAEAVKMLGVSEATARRLFAGLEKSGKIVRNYGGIQLAEYQQEYSFENHEKVFQAEKALIGKAAAELVSDGDTVYLDSGTTVFQMTLALNTRIAAGAFKSLNVVTNSIANIQAVTPASGIRIILVGGEYNSRRRDFSGPLTEKYLALLHFTKCFLGCDGVAADMGFSSNQLSISSLNMQVLERADKAFVLMDQSKFGRRTMVSYAPLSAVGTIVTDGMPDHELAGILSRSGVGLQIACAADNRKDESDV